MGLDRGTRLIRRGRLHVAPVSHITLLPRVAPGYVAALMAVLLALGAVVAWWARFVAPFRMQVKQVAIQLPRKHPELDGLTIAFVTDTHVGPHFRAADLAPVVDELQKLKPDLVLFGGDFICESPRFISEAAPVIGEMARSGRLGAFGVLGNHDLANLRERVVPPLEEAGVPILQNQSVRVETGHGDLWLVGVDDAQLGEPDLEAAYRDVPVDAASICLWHAPDVAEQAAPFGSFLMLSGHTHGGQVRLPGIGPLAAPELGEKHVQGRFQFGDMELYVSTGLGIYRPPVRLNCPPELTIIRLIA